MGEIRSQVRFKDTVLTATTAAYQHKEKRCTQHDDVLEWKHTACEVFKVYAPPGKAPLVKARATHAYSCYDPTCSHKNRTNCLDTYIKHLLDTQS